MATQIRGSQQILDATVTLAKLEPGTVAGQLLIVGAGTGFRPAYTAMGGDATINSNGTLTIAEDAVTPLKTSFYDHSGTPFWNFQTGGSPTDRILRGVLTPVNDNDAANKAYVDSLSQGLKIKAAVRLASIENMTLSGLSHTIDGVTPLVDGDRILVKDQSTNSENGIYVAHAGAWTRATDMNTWDEVPGAYCYVQYGSALSHTGWVCTSSIDGNTPGSIGVIGTDDILFEQFSGAGDYSHAAPITLTGNVFGLDYNTTSFALSGSQFVLKSDVAGDALGLTNHVLNVKFDNVTIGNSSDALYVKDDGITNVQVISGGGSTCLRRTNMDIAGSGSATTVLTWVDEGTLAEGWGWSPISSLISSTNKKGVIVPYTSPNVWTIPTDVIVADSHCVFVNGIRQRGGGVDYTISGTNNNVITFTAGEVVSGDIVLCDYTYVP